jgi:hypothetical protein
MYAHINGVDLFFDIEGGGYMPDGLTVSEKPTLVLLHGGPGFDHSYFKPWLLPLTEQANWCSSTTAATGAPAGSTSRPTPSSRWPMTSRRCGTTWVWARSWSSATRSAGWSRRSTRCDTRNR